LFAVDYSDGMHGAQNPAAGMLVLTCNIDECRHKATYTGDDVVLRLQKSQTDLNNS